MPHNLFKPRPGARYLAGAFLGLAGLLGGCVEPYTPPAISAPQSYLVVDGSINLNGVTTVRLSRTRNLGTGAASPVEAKASVAILDETGARYALAEQAAGTYAAGPLVLGTAHRYQLRLRTAAGREYASDLVAAKATPAIDSLAWAAGPDGVQVYVNSHDAANATRYYRWAYQETWQFHSAYQSALEYVGGAIKYRAENIYWCWRTENSTAIALSSTDKLSQDVVSRFPLALLPRTSAKLAYGYSILVQQYAQTPEEFAYWDKLRRNTESLGTLFDPLPSQLSGNVHSLDDAAELVLGYVGAGSVAEKRLFIADAQLPRGYIRPVTGYESCSKPDTVLLKNVATRFSVPGFLPIEPLGTYVPYAYTGAPEDCVDCRLRGTNAKPSFWP
ncbi:MAG: DUF4249 domain-containing protein [Janthinobacterium lividum]